jgi:hypothetical protein
MRNEIYENEGRVLLPTEKPTVLPMQPWCSVRVREAFPSLRLGGHVDGIGGRSYQSFAEGAVHAMTEVATAVHSWRKIACAHLDP